MPVMLMSEDYDRWLDRATGVDDLKAIRLFDGSVELPGDLGAAYYLLTSLLNRIRFV